MIHRSEALGGGGNWQDVREHEPKHNTTSSSHVTLDTLLLLRQDGMPVDTFVVISKIIPKHLDLSFKASRS